MVAYYRQILEAEGIAVMYRNEHLTMSGLSEIPIPEFYPNLCVMNDEDYSRAREILQKVIHEDGQNSDKEVKCPSCGEMNPGNFDFCFACEGALGDMECGEGSPL